VQPKSVPFGGTGEAIREIKNWIFFPPRRMAAASWF